MVRFAKSIQKLYICVVTLSGCATFFFLFLIHLTSKTFDIRSHKDITVTNLSYIVETNGTVSLTIGKYEAKSNVEVIRAAVEAQQQQIEGSLKALNQILQAAGASKVIAK